jgi:hypothetical protein
MRVALLLILALFCCAPASARPVVVELFTSEACSSCPPAEALLAELQARDPNVLPLAFHVTYWNGPAWSDKYSLQAATDRQAWYAGLQHSDNVYTPEAVVDGGAQLVGSDRGAMKDALAAAGQNMAPAVPVSVTGGPMLGISLGDATAAGTANIWLIGYDPRHVTRIGGGENGGATVVEVNVVRSFASLGTWLGGLQRFTIPPPAGQRTAVILQKSDGTIEGAATD